MLKKTRTILAELNMTCMFDEYKKLWPGTVQCVVYVYNRMLTKEYTEGCPKQEIPMKSLLEPSRTYRT